VPAHLEHAAQFPCWNGGFWFDGTHKLHDAPEGIVELCGPEMMEDRDGWDLTWFPGEGDLSQPYIKGFHYQMFGIGVIRADGTFAPSEMLGSGPFAEAL
jgi:hypothetical protein